MPGEPSPRASFSLVSFRLAESSSTEQNRVLNHENGILLNKLVEISQGKQLSVGNHSKRTAHSHIGKHTDSHRDLIS